MPLNETTTSFRGDGVVLAASTWVSSSTPAGIVLLLHGGGQTRHSWQQTGRRLAAHGWVV